MTSRYRDRDRSLGMDRPITRRQFVNGVSVAVTGSLLSSSWLQAFGVPVSPFQYAPEKDPSYYPPRTHRPSWKSRRRMGNSPCHAGR
jgi:hypothetical protein